MSGLLWTIIVVLFIAWIIGFAVAHVGSIIHILLLAALVLLVWNLISGRGARITT
jgi:hypothetical protein